MGTISLGPLSLQLGAFLSLVLPAGRVISGTIRHLEETLTIVAEFAGRPRQKWLVEGVVGSDSPEFEVRRLVRQLAYEMVLSFRSTSLEVTSYRRNIEGLERYEAFISSGNIIDLNEAERRFSQAVTTNQTFSSAYHNLGVVHEMRFRVMQELGNRSGSGQLLERAEAMYRRALELEPTRSDSLIQLGRIALERENFEAAVDVCRKGVEALARGGQSNPLAHYWLAESLSMRADVHGQDVSHDQETTVRDYTEALIQYQRARHELLALRRERRLSTSTREDLRPIENELAEVALGLARTERKLSTVIAKTARKNGQRHLRRAEKALRSAAELRPDRSDVHTELGQFLADPRVRSMLTSRGIRTAVHRTTDRIRFRKGHQYTIEPIEELIEAFSLDPGNLQAVLALAELLAHWDPGAAADSSGSRQGDLPATGWKADHEPAREALLIALAINPDDTGTWAKLADHAARSRDVDGALSLAGVALALSPWTIGPYKQLSHLYSIRHADDETGSAQDNAAAQVYELLARTLPQQADPLAWLEEQVRSSEASKDGAAVGGLRSLQWVLGWLLSTRPQQEADGLKWLETARSHVPLLREALLTHHEIARLCKSSGMPDHALEELEKSAQTVFPFLGEAAPMAWQLDLADAYVELAADRDRALNAYSKLTSAEAPTLELVYEGPSGSRRATVRGEALGFKSQARAFAGRAALYADTNQRVEAMNDCIAAIRIDPTYAYPRVVLAELLRTSGNYDRALLEWKIIGALIPYRSYADLNTGDIWYERAQLTKDPSTRNVRLNRAVDAYTAGGSDPPPV